MYLFLDLPVHKILSAMLWNVSNSSTLLALPLFILMGDILIKTRISNQLFKGLTPWVSKIPGGLLHINIFASALFAAITGSVAATTASVGKITIPELEDRGYAPKLIIGSLASAGTLGIMIPPSMPMLVYGIIANVSIGKMFISGIVPGLSLMILFSLYIAVRDKGYLARKHDVFSRSERISSIYQISPTLVLITVVLGSIYLGWATPTEAAAIGVGGSALIGLLTGSMGKSEMLEIVKSTTKTSSMIIMILVGASFFSTALGFLGIPKYLCNIILASNISKTLVMAMITAVYLFLGCLIDGFSMIVMTVPIFLPIINAFSYNPIWFGIYIVLLVQIANITPPVGFNLFLVNGISRYSIGQISRWVLPFLSIMILFVIFIMLFPDFVSFLPNMVFQ
jgi:C4-dicarboxylate transporter, DctM subunit